MLKHYNLYQKLLVFFLCSLSQTVLLNGQNQEINKEIFLSGLQFSASGYSGFTKFGFDPSNKIPLKSPLLTQNSASIEAQYYFKKGFYLATSFGLLFTTQKNYRKPGGMEWYKYLDGLTWLPYIKTDLGLGYSKLYKSSGILSYQLKFGVVHTNKSKLNRHQDDSAIETNNKLHPFLNVQSKYGWQFKNRNLLEIGIYYHHSFSDIYFGTYTSSNATTAFSGTGSELGLSLGYVFTGYARRMEKNKSTESFKKYKKDRKHIDRNARLLEFSIDQFSMININKDPEGIIINSAMRTIGGRIEAEFGINENRFWETGLHLGPYWQGFTILNEDKTAKWRSSHSGVDYTLALNFGYGYRVTTKEKINIFTISAGLTINGNLSGSSVGNSSVRWPDGIYAYQLSYIGEIKSVIFASLYFNINKDFQLTKNTYLSFNYRYNLGLNATLVRSYEAETYGSEVRNFEGKINGTSHSYNVGLKFNIGVSKRNLRNKTP